MADKQVGEYFKTHFVSAFQKVGTFRVDNGQKQGGNVASYFCLADGRVLHAIPGPVDAATLLREARWVVDTFNMAKLKRLDNNYLLGTFFCKAHRERLQSELGMERVSQISWLSDRSAEGTAMWLREPPLQNLSKLGQIHAILVRESLIPIERVYRFVFEEILGEKVSTEPVTVTRRK
ncbi:MAG TPA: hypothetical protein VGZ47_12625 [Gemmataceae bacterium]|nr:hypothetical protein [Gemmataceae bacterium]